MGILDRYRQRAYGRTMAEQRRNMEYEVWQSPRGKGRSSATGKDGIAREQLAAKRLSELGYPERIDAETHSGGSLTFRPMGNDRLHQSVGPGKRHDESKRKFLKYVLLGGAAVGIGTLLAESGGIPFRIGNPTPGANSPSENIFAKRIEGVRYASEFDTTTHTGTSADPWSSDAPNGALADLPSTGGQVLSPAGLYAVSDIDLHRGVLSNVLFAGVGAATIYRLPPMTNKNILKADSMAGLEIADLELDGSQALQDATAWSMKATGGPAETYEIYNNNIFLTNCPRLTVRNVYSHDALNNGILVQSGGFEAEVVGCFVERCQWHGIEYWSGGLESLISGCRAFQCWESPIVVELSAPSPENVTVVGCIVDGSLNPQSAFDGIRVQTNDHVVLSGNVVYQGRIMLSDSSDCLIIGNLVYVNNAQTHGIRMAGSRNRCIGNSVSSPFYDGVRMETGDDNIADGNAIQAGNSTVSNAIHIVGRSHNIVAHNHVLGYATGVGILEDAGSDYNLIDGNMFDGVTGTKVALAGANSLAVNNLG